MEPFYADDRVVIFHANAFELLPLLPVVDCVVVDAPYSAKTQGGHDSGTRSANRVVKANGVRDTGKPRQVITYPPWSDGDVARAVDMSAPRCRGWYVSITDDVLAPRWRADLERHRRLGFAPLPFVERGAGCRFQGDGPSSWTRSIVVARPRTKAFTKWGTLDGAYVMPPGADEGEAKRCIGGKPVWLLVRLITDYSKPGDIVLDYCAGYGTAGTAAKRTGRRAILIESDEEACTEAARRIERTPAQEPIAVAERPPPAEQLALVVVEDGYG